LIPNEDIRYIYTAFCWSFSNTYIQRQCILSLTTALQCIKTQEPYTLARWGLEVARYGFLLLGASPPPLSVDFIKLSMLDSTETYIFTLVDCCKFF
jgi:hypothetical protein